MIACDQPKRNPKWTKFDLAALIVIAVLTAIMMVRDVTIDYFDPPPSTIKAQTPTPECTGSSRHDSQGTSFFASSM